ncbi:MAG TPA: response regulator [Rubrivivax sp.]|nr:response regulator [Rubrivivax sp.]
MTNRKARVMVVDDHVLNVELVRFILDAEGFGVALAGDAQQALAQLPSFAPDLILMDIQMPGIDGLALTRQLKADTATRGIVIVAFTAYAMKGDEARMMAAGCDGYISKPIEVATFAAQVRALLPDGLRA